MVFEPPGVGVYPLPLSYLDARSKVSAFIAKLLSLFAGTERSLVVSRGSLYGASGWRVGGTHGGLLDKADLRTLCSVSNVLVLFGI